MKSTKVIKGRLYLKISLLQAQGIYRLVSLEVYMLRIYQQKFTIIRHRIPSEATLNQRLQWLGTSLGLFNLRDKDSSCFRVFVELIKAAKLSHPPTSDELAYRTGLTRGTVIHHLNKLMESGIVVHSRNAYTLRVDNLKELVDEVERDVLRAMKELRAVAEEVDGKIGL